MVRLRGLSEQRRAPSSLGSYSPALPRNLTLMPPAGATTISPPPALAPEGAGLQWGNLCPLDLAPSLRSCLSGSVEPAPSPHQAHQLGSCPGGHRDVIPGGMGLNGGIVPARSRAESGRDRAETGNVPGATQGGFVLLLLPLPPCPPRWPPPSHSHPDHRPSPGPLLRLLHGLGRCSCCGGGAQDGLGQFCRSKVSSQNDSAPWSWV